MATLTLIPPEHANAIREDSLSTYADLARKQHDVLDLYVMPRRCTLRIGEPPVRDIAHMNEADFQTRLKVPVEWTPREPQCRCCGRRLGHGTHVIRFGFKPNYWQPYGKRAFIHADRQECLTL